MGQIYLLFSIKLGHRALAWMAPPLHRLDSMEDTSTYKVGKWSDWQLVGIVREMVLTVLTNDRKIWRRNNWVIL